MAKNDFSALILAAGEGTRMKSSTPKVLHKLNEVPILKRVLETVESLKPRSIGIVVGAGSARVRREIGGGSTIWIEQKARRGSGHAVQTAMPWIRRSLKSSPHLLILCGDTPLLKAETLRELHDFHRAQGNSATVLSALLENPFGYGRIVKGGDGTVRRIVEEKDASAQEKEIREVNSGVYCFQSEKLLEALPELKNENAKGEYYLTDVIEILNRKDRRAGAVTIKNGSLETVGVNSRADLALAEAEIQKEILKRWMDAGVTVISPAATYIGEEAEIGRDTVLLPGTMLLGKTKIGEGCKIGPNAFIEDSAVGDMVSIRASFIYGSRIEEDVKIGPFAHLRPGTVVKKGARVGNFTEIKQSRIGKDSKVSHLSYIGDTEIGDDVNVGAGVVTCNFDGVKKHKTVIGKKSFVGSNVNLVAPVRIGEGAVIGAGSTITEDVPAHALAIERTQQTVKKGWARRKKGK